MALVHMSVMCAGATFREKSEMSGRSELRSLEAGEIERRIRVGIDDGDQPTIDGYGALLDTLEPTRARPGLHASALWYASIGLRVFPLQPRSKTPLARSHGCKDASNDVDQIDAWWTTTPDANVGIATGHIVDAIDIDGLAGNISWARLVYDEADFYDGPDVLGIVSTARDGGRHLYVRATPGRGNGARVLPGIDHRGHGGYVVAPPSINDAGRAYTWTRPLDLKGT